MKKNVEAVFKVLCICLVIFSISISCGSDDDPVAPTPVKPTVPDPDPATPGPDDDAKCSITQVDYTTFSFSVTRNDEGLPVELSYTKYHDNAIDFKTHFEYDASGRLIKLGNETIFFTYEYDDRDRVILEKYVAQPGAPLPYTVDSERHFTYNDKGQLDSAYYAPDMYERYVYDEDGNMVRRYLRYPETPEFLASEYLEFDDKHNPFDEFPFRHSFYLKLSGVDYIVTLFNPVRHTVNVLKQKSYGGDGSETSYTANYSYNDSGYPISGDPLKSVSYECE